MESSSMTPTAQEEVAGLEKVLMRLAMTEEPQLQTVLSKLVPIVIGTFKSPHELTRKKAMEILSHVNKRVKGVPAIKLPLTELTDMAVDPQAAAMVRSFALVYAEMAFERAAQQERLAVLPKLLTGVASRPAQHAAILSRLAFTALEGYTTPSAALPLPAAASAVPSGAAGDAAGAASAGAAAGSSSSSSGGAGAGAGAATASAAGVSPEAAARYPFLASDADRRFFLDAALKVLLYQPRSASPAAARITPLGMANQDAAAVAAAAAAVALPSPGLSAADMKAIEEKGAPTGEALVRRKLGVLNLIAAAGCPPGETIVHLLVASCDPSDAVARRGEEMLKRSGALDAARPTVDVEEPSLISRLFSLFHGNATGTTLDAGVPEDKRVQAASTPVRCKLVSSVFCRSIAAANAFPATIQTISECVLEGSSARLKALGMEFAVWVFKHAAIHQLKAMGPTVLKGLLDTLDESVGSPDHATSTLRGFAYTAVGCLAQRLPDMLKERTDIAHRFFAALADEPPGLRAVVAEAASSLSAAYAYSGLTDSQQQELDGLLLTSIGSAKDAVRLSAVQWANRLAPFSHMPARYVCVLAAADTKLEVRDEGLRGLRLTQQQQQQQSAGGAASDYPSLDSLLTYVQQKLPRLRKASAEAATAGGALPLQPKSYLALLRFARDSWQQQQKPVAVAGGEGADVEMSDAGKEGAVPEGYLTLLEVVLASHDASSELTVAALQALLDAGVADPTALEARYAGRTAWLAGFLSHVDGGAREAAARLLGVATAGMTAEAAAALLTGLLPNFSAASAASAAAVGGAGSTPGSVKFELQEGSILAAGYILAQLLAGKPGVSADAARSAAAAAAAALLATAAPRVGGASGSSSTAAPLMAATAALSLCRAAVPGGLAALAQLLPEAPQAPVVEPQPAAGSADAAGQAAAAPLVQRVLALMQDKDSKVMIRAITAAGFLAWAAGRPSSAAADAAGQQQLEAQAAQGAAVLQALVRALLALSSSKAEDVQFAVGEALAHAFGGVDLTPAKALRSNFTSLADDHAMGPAAVASGGAAGPAAAPAAGAAAASAMEVDGGANGAPATAAAGGDAAAAEYEAGVRRGVQEAVMKSLLKELIYHSRAEVRCAATVWLVSLLTFCGKRSPVLLGALSEVQEALSALLGDANELTQEMASRGVSLVYSLGDESQRQALVGALVGVLQGGPKAKQAVKLSGDTQVLEEGVITTKAGGPSSSSTSSATSSLSTYQELCSLATELGQPDLIYKFMDLAHHQQALNTRRGAAFGFAGIAKLAAGEQLQKHVAALIPKLYRYLYDPNPRVSDSMTHIWRSLVDDPKQAVDKAFEPIMKDLLKEMGGRLWRNRQAACGAMADLLQSRRWPELRPHFITVWAMALRCMDDIKESVRLSGASLSKTLRGLALRLVDPQFTPGADCAEVMAAVVPLLLEQGLMSSVPEIRGLSLDTLAKAAKSTSPAALKPLLPSLVGALLEALSSLEDSRLNYIEQHAERLGLDSERLDSARAAAARSSPLGDTLELAARIAGGDAGETGGCMDGLVPVLTGIIKRGVGLNTKVGAARFVRSVAQRAGSGIQRHAPALLKALIAAVSSERSVTVRKAYAGAAAQVCKYATAKRQDKVVVESVEMYGASAAAESSDRDARYAGGLLLRELLRSCPEVVQGHGARVLPTAFGARMDDDAEVAAVWKEVWEEGVSSEAAAVRLYRGEVTGLLCEGLASQQWGRKKACAHAVKALTELGADLLQPEHVASLAGALLAEVAAGRLWDGKEDVVEALGALAQAYPRALQTGGLHVRVLSAALAAAGRKKAVYRSAGLRCLQAALTAFEGDHYALVAPPLLDATRRHCAGGAAEGGAGAGEAPAAGKDNNGDGQEGEQAPLLPLPESLACLAAAVAKLGTPAASSAPSSDVIRGQLDELASVLASVLAAQLPWQQRLAAVQATQALVQRADKLAGAAPSGEGAAVAAGQPLLPRAAIAPWACQLAPGLSTCAVDLKIQQVRSASLACLEDLLRASAAPAAAAAGATAAVAAAPTAAADAMEVDAAGAAAGAGAAQAALPAALVAAIHEAMAAVTESDKSAAIVSAAARVRGLLPERQQ